MSNFSSSIKYEDYEFTRSPIEGYKLNIVGTYLLIVFVLSFLVNSLLLLGAILFNKCNKSSDAFVLSCIFTSFIGTITEFPFAVLAPFAHRWIFKWSGCVISAFIMYSVGCIQIFLMSAISIERFITFLSLSKNKSIRGLDFGTNCRIVLLCVFLGLMAPIAPLFGWSKYTLNTGKVSCDIEWREQSFNVLSYNITIFVFVFCLPLFCIVICNLGLIIIIKRESRIQRRHSLHQNRKRLHRWEKEKKATIILSLFISIFTLTWLPYAFVSFYAMFINPDHISPMVTIIPSIVAKSSLLYDSLFLLLTNKKLYTNMKNMNFIFFARTNTNTPAFSDFI